MPIKIVISTNGNQYELSQTEQLVNEQVTPQQTEEQTQQPKTSKAGNVAIVLATAKIVANATKQIANKLLTEYADLSGNVMYANQKKRELNGLNFTNYVNETIQSFKTYQKEQNRIAFLRERSGNNTLNGSRWTDD